MPANGPDTTRPSVWRRTSACVPRRTADRSGGRGGGAYGRRRGGGGEGRGAGAELVDRAAVPRPADRVVDGQHSVRHVRRAEPVEVRLGGLGEPPALAVGLEDPPPL